MKVSVRAFAKINLLLDLTSVLSNGYHSIYTVMQSVGIYDIITAETVDIGCIKLTCSDNSVPLTSENTAVKAAELFYKKTKIPFSGLKINIQKNIPLQAGMAGGSADAAAVIKALDHIHNTCLSDSDMFEIGEKIGADVPFCISGGTKLCLNKGEVMAPLPDFPDCSIVVAKPLHGVSTKEAYKNFDQAEQIRHPDNDGFLYASTVKDLKMMCEKASNVFEQVVEVPDRVRIKSIMRENNALLSMMTGSGAAIFGIFEKEPDANNCYNSLLGKYKDVFITKPSKSGISVIKTN